MTSQNVKVKYFAALREASQKAEEDVPLHSGDTGAALYLRLAEQYGFELRLSDIRLAVDEAFVPIDQELRAGEEVVFIPPVAGG